ncbi:hypothetical protein JJB27_09245 [Campylobacter fetus subsp. venerealis]|uniref:hypothetical protein n=1 Tax=Campylobacter fetus TaxID=196 RepID=UPI00190AE548|nr:hypothetical protein [Campylobacter fetus]MBK3499249.1 hypothetical protein [Campylobacter fetus subsp. venerealis]MBK3503208.1 hypothetical protein [Campylobacter fetus subsp. venerealis]HDX8135986.1 hypothetical protein [Campylobacter fetus subsp. venerealis]
MRLLFFTILTFIFIGCTPKAGPNYFHSINNVPKDIQITNLNIIADDIVNFISSRKTPNDTIIYLYTQDKDKSFFDYLSNKFRQKGYAITENQDKKNLTFLSYIIQKENNLLLVTYNFNESKINRIYIVENNKIISSGPISTFNLD